MAYLSAIRGFFGRSLRLPTLDGPGKAVYDVDAVDETT